jgi:hypothetical protein
MINAAIVAYLRQKLPSSEAQLSISWQTTSATIGLGDILLQSSTTTPKLQ